MHIPTEAISSLHNLPEVVSRDLPRDMSIHGSLAAQLALHRETMDNWAVKVPELSAFQDTMPMFWPRELRDLLPAEAKSLVDQQRSRFESDWNKFAAAFHDASREKYLHCWLLVNTRAFYFETSLTAMFPWHDRLALLPLADMFNHDNVGCALSFSTDGYTLTADRPYSAGEEVCISYGNHSNDFLLAEYGFILPANDTDRICLDEIILPRLSSRQSSELLENGYPDGFTLNTESEAHDNIWIALRLLCSTEADWPGYVNGEEDAQGTLDQAADLLSTLLEEYLDRVDDNLTIIHALRIGKPQHRALLGRRWEQLKEVASQLIDVEWFIDDLDILSDEEFDEEPTVMESITPT